MALDNINKTILAEAEAEAKRIKSESEGNLAALSSEYRRRATQELAKAAKLQERSVRQAKDQARFAAKIKVRNAILAEKQELVGQAFSQAVADLEALGGKERQSLIRKLVNLLPKTEGGTIRAAKADQEAVKKEAGNLAGIRVEAEALSSGGGFVFSSDSVEIDCTFASLVAARRQDLAQEVANMLF